MLSGCRHVQHRCGGTKNGSRCSELRGKGQHAAGEQGSSVAPTGLTLESQTYAIEWGSWGLDLYFEATCRIPWVSSVVGFLSLKRGSCHQKGFFVTLRK